MLTFGIHKFCLCYDLSSKTHFFEGKKRQKMVKKGHFSPKMTIFFGKIGKKTKKKKVKTKTENGKSRFEF